MSKILCLRTDFAGPLRILSFTFLLTFSFLFLHGNLYAQSLEGLTPAQRQAAESLAPAQRQAVESELSKTGGQVTPETIETLKKKPEFKELKPEGGAKEKEPLSTEKMAPEEERAEEKVKTPVEEPVKEPLKEKEEKIEMTQKVEKAAQPLKRFGMDFFAPARNRILSLEEMLGRGQKPPVGQRDALSGFVGPLDMVSSYVNATIPPQYVLNPGDTVIIHYWGDLLELTELTLTLNSKGEVSIPKVGMLVVRGMMLAQFQSAAKDQLQRVFGKNISLIATLDNLKSIQIFMTGEVFRPGSYAVSAVTTLFNALYASGGPNKYGSLREVKLLRNNKTINIDFYNYLLKGESKDDYPLQAGDTIFISKLGKLVSIEGEVNRPGLFELKGEERFKDLVSLANGIKPTGLLQRVQIKSVIPNRERVILDVDISKNAPSQNQELFDGDSVVISSVLPEAVNIVTIEGKVERPGVYELKKEMKVSDLFTEINRPLGEAYMERADILRLNRDRKTTTLIPINLAKALEKDTVHDLKLSPMDKLVVYSKWDVKFIPPRTVTVSGSVQKPGDYERSDGMTIRDLLIKAGGVLPNSYLERADLMRFDFEKEIYVNIPVNLIKVLAGDKSENRLLQDKDSLQIYLLKEIVFIPPHEVSIYGAVQRPGTYPRFSEMRLTDLLLVSGGVVPGSVEQIEIAKARSEGQIKVITADLDLLHKGDESQNVALEDGDVVMIRKKSEFYDSPRWVTVSGEVKYPGTYALYGKEDKISDVIERAGGLTRYAHPKGTVLTRKREHFPSDEQRRDVVITNKIINALNELEYNRQLARNEWLLQKEFGKAERPRLPGAGTPVVATSGTPSEAAAIGMAPGVAQAAGEVAGGIIETFESPPGVISSSRKLGEPELLQGERVIISLKEALKGGGEDIILMDGDTIHIPQKVKTVSVVGAITRPTTIHFTDNRKVDYYIQNSGGYTDDANAKRVLVMRVDGSITPADKVKYVEEGDIIYVPPKVISLDIVERIDKVIDVVKFTLVTVASVAVFITLIGLF